MIKLLFVALALMGFYGATMGFCPSVWTPFQWSLPLTQLHASWGIVGMCGVVYFGFKLKA